MNYNDLLNFSERLELFHPGLNHKKLASLVEATLGTGQELLPQVHANNTKVEIIYEEFTEVLGRMALASAGASAASAALKVRLMICLIGSRHSRMQRSQLCSVLFKPLVFLAEQSLHRAAGNVSGQRNLSGRVQGSASPPLMTKAVLRSKGKKNCGTQPFFFFFFQKVEATPGESEKSVWRYPSPVLSFHFLRSCHNYADED